MNNKMKLVGGAAAGLLALGMIGGGTFAAWSDWETIGGNEISSGILALDLTGQDGGTLKSINFGSLMPGGVSESAVFVASSDAASVPDGLLSMTVQNLKQVEDGCSNANSEAAVDPECLAGASDTTGDLAKVLNVQASYWAAPSALECGNYASADHAVAKGIWVSGVGNFTGKQDVKFPITELAPGQGVCVFFGYYWDFGTLPSATDTPATQDNAAQGDSLEFDLRFDLEQVK